MTIRTCPECHSRQVVTTYEQMVDANTFDHYCHSVKAHDSDSKAQCLECNWTGERKDLEGEDE